MIGSISRHQPSSSREGYLDGCLHNHELGVPAGSASIHERTNKEGGTWHSGRPRFGAQSFFWPASVGGISRGLRIDSLRMLGSPLTISHGTRYRYCPRAPRSRYYTAIRQSPASSHFASSSLLISRCQFIRTLM